jgi:hypothetical protein
MKMKHFGLIFVVLLSGCTSTIKTAAVIKNGQKSVYKDGVEYVYSKKHSTVALASMNSERDASVRPSYYVYALNETKDDQLISTENVKAFITGNQIKVFTYEEIAKEIEDKRKAAVFAAALSGAIQSYNAASAGNQYTTGTYNTNYYSKGRYVGTSTSTYTSHTYDQGAAIRAQNSVNAQTQNNMDRINDSANIQQSAAKAQLLRKNTVTPNAECMGYVLLDKTPVPEKGKENALAISVDFAGERHEFDFSETLKQ